MSRSREYVVRPFLRHSLLSGPCFLRGKTGAALPPLREKLSPVSLRKGKLHFLRENRVLFCVSRSSDSHIPGGGASCARNLYLLSGFRRQWPAFAARFRAHVHTAGEKRPLWPDSHRLPSSPYHFFFKSPVRDTTQRIQFGMWESLKLYGNKTIFQEFPLAYSVSQAVKNCKHYLPRKEEFSTAKCNFHRLFYRIMFISAAASATSSRIAELPSEAMSAFRNFIMEASRLNWS